MAYLGCILLLFFWIQLLLFELWYLNFNLLRSFENLWIESFKQVLRINLDLGLFNLWLGLVNNLCQKCYFVSSRPRKLRSEFSIFITFLLLKSDSKINYNGVLTPYLDFLKWAESQNLVCGLVIGVILSGSRNNLVGGRLQTLTEPKELEVLARCFCYTSFFKFLVIWPIW